MIYLVLIALLAQLSLQQDPVNDFCRRFGQQTAVLGRKLYIDGGLVNYNDDSVNSTNTYLLYNDLDDVTDDGMPQLFANLTKGSSVPDVSGGILWADDVNEVFYRYGGDFSGSPQSFQLWGYDGVYNTWNSTSPQGSPPGSTAWGAGVSINETATGYWYGGWQSDTATPGWSGPANMSNSLVAYDMIGNTLDTGMGPDLLGRAEGVMLFLPASDGGLLVYFGGLVDAGNGTAVASNMSTIYIYDIASSKWYSQTATGAVPPNRRRFCAGAAWPDDQSSYNIYLYGGAGIAPDTAGFDDVYILSLPTFTWIKAWPTEPGPGSPHNGMTCNVIDGAQMLVIGGTFPLTDDCDSMNVWGTHNMNLGYNGPNKAIWDKFDPSIQGYEVPAIIVKEIGGGSTGGATATQPSAWDNRDLPTYFSRSASFPPRTATRTIPTATAAPSGGSKSSTPIGAIVGGVLGGVIVLILLLITVWCCLRRRKETQSSPKRAPPVREATPQELPTHRWSSIEVPANAKSSVSSTASPTIRSDNPSSPHSTSSSLASQTQSFSNGNQYAHYAPPAHLGALHENQASHYDHHRSSSRYELGSSPSSPTSPTSQTGVLPNTHTGHLYPQPLEIYQPQPHPYNPREHPLHQQRFSPPPSTSPRSPRSTQQTPAHHYGPNSSPNGSRFVEGMN